MSTPANTGFRVSDGQVIDLERRRRAAPDRARTGRVRQPETGWRTRDVDIAASLTRAAPEPGPEDVKAARPLGS